MFAKLGLTMLLATAAMADVRLAAPLSFEPNQGQADAQVAFVSRGSGYEILLGAGEVVLNRASAGSVRMSLVGAAGAKPVALAKQSGVVNYFIGNDPKKWRTGIPTYGKVNYAEVYPGVDLLFYGRQRELEYDFVVAPGADPSPIAWKVEGARAKIDRQGNLLLGSAMFRRPVAYQAGREVAGWFVVEGDRVRFRVGEYDHSKTLVIDPVLSYSSYLDGSLSDAIGYIQGPGVLQVGATPALAIDSTGAVYVTGYAHSIDFPVAKAIQSTPPAKLPGVAPGSWNTAFVSKFSADGSSLVYSTYLGGNGTDYGYAIAVDSAGSAYVTGLTTSPDFPITNGAYQTVCSPTPSNGAPPYTPSCNSSYNWSVFVTKLNPNGTGLVYSTFLGGYGNAYGTAIAVDSAGRAYIAGNEMEYCSPGYKFQGCFPTTSDAILGGDKPGGGSPQYAFVAAIDPTGSKLLYSTIWGDSTMTGGATWATGVAVDSSGYFYLAGETEALNMPVTPGVVQPTGGPAGNPATYVNGYRGFVAKFKPVTTAAGVSLEYSTYLGGKTAALNDYISGIAVDSSSNVYVVGYTNSPDFPVTTGAYSTVCGLTGTCAAAHVTKLNPSGSAIVWSTFVGGAKADGSDRMYFTGPIQLDGNGNVYIMGQVATSFPMVNSIEPYPAGGSMQVAVVELDPTGSNMLFSTIVGSNAADTGNPAGLAVDRDGNIFVAGNTPGSNLITTPGAFQAVAASGACCFKPFVARIAARGTAGVSVVALPGYALLGTPVILIATVTAQQKYASAPSGTVTFQSGNSVLGSATLDSSGVAVFLAWSLGSGSETFTAAYSGDSTYAAGSASASVVVSPF